MNPLERPTRPSWAAVLGLIGLLAGACGTVGDGIQVTPSIVPGSSSAPREVNLIARDYSFVPDTLELVPGETILLHVINAGLIVHEAIIGDTAVQDAWEAAEAAAAGAPPGPTPAVSVSPDVAGVRVVVGSGERVDLTWTVPADAAEPLSGAAGGGAGSTWLVGCHIPGHWGKGMWVPVRWVWVATNTATTNIAGATPTY